MQFAYQDSIYSTTIKNEADGSVNNPDNFTVNIKNGNIGGITYLTDGFVKKLNYTWAGNSYYTAIVMSSTQGLKLERYKNNTKTNLISISIHLIYIL